MIRNIENAEHYTWGQVCDGWRFVNGKDLSVIQERIPPGAGEVKHYHQRARQLFFVLAGELIIELGARTHRLTSGDAMEVPPGEPHRVHNSSTAEVMFLVVSAPTTQGDRVNL